MQAAPYGGKQSTAICFVTDYYYHLCIISALVSCGWWPAPAGARLFFRCIFSGGRAVRIGPISLPFVSCGWWAAPAGARIRDMLQCGELIKVNRKRDVYEIAGSPAHAYNAEYAPRRDLY
jgi:hypothetical protein